MKIEKRISLGNKWYMRQGEKLSDFFYATKDLAIKDLEEALEYYDSRKNKYVVDRREFKMWEAVEREIFTTYSINKKYLDYMQKSEITSDRLIQIMRQTIFKISEKRIAQRQEAINFLKIKNN